MLELSNGGKMKYYEGPRTFHGNKGKQVIRSLSNLMT
jgi:hypothetical protein